MSKRAVEIRDMLENGINNTAEYKIQNVELILDAARLLLEALSKNEIQIQQLADQKIGQTVNLIRKNNKEIAPVKTMLRNVVQKMQDLARRGDSNAGGRPRPNGTTVNGHTNERRPPKKVHPKVSGQNGKSENGASVNGHEHENRRSTPNELETHPRLPKVSKVTEIETKKEKKSGRKSKNRSSPKVRTGSTPNAAPDANIHPSPPKIKSAPPSNPSLIKSITLRYGDEEKILLDRKNTESPPVSTRIATPEPKKPPGDDRIDKPPSQQQPSQNNIPNETENVPNENLSELKSTNPSSNNSIPTLPEDNHHSRKRKLPTANPTDTQSESVSTITKTETEMLFSDRVRFIPSVTVEPDQKIIIPSTPDHKVVSQAAEGEEMEGITGVRDVQGNFHRWHQEISLEPDGTEPFMHILPYVDIDLELL